jgi:tetratricopeptide (TPR) repeat protein
MELFNPLSWSMQLAAWAAPGIKAWSLERSMNRAEGERHLKARNYEEAEKYFQSAVDEADHLRHSVRKVQFRLQLAEAQRKLKKFEEAEKTVRDALEYTARVSNPSGYVQCLDALAEIFHDAENYPAMEAALQEGVRIESAMPQPDAVRMARRVHRLGTARYKSGRAEEAIPELEKALQLLRIHEHSLGFTAEETIRDLHHLAGSLEECGDIDGASVLYERTLLNQQRIIGGDLEELAEMQFGLAGIYIGWGNYARARELLSEAVGIFRRKKGPRLAITHEAVAHVEECSGRYLEAVAELARAGKVWEACGDQNRPQLIENLEHRAELLEQLRKRGEATWLRERAAALMGHSEAQSA